MRSSCPFDSHFTDEINRAKFNICTPNSYGEVKSHTHARARTDRIVFYCTDFDFILI